MYTEMNMYSEQEQNSILSTYDSNASCHLTHVNAKSFEDKTDSKEHSKS